MYDLSEVYGLFIQGSIIGGLLTFVPFILGYVIDLLFGVANK